MKKQPALEIKPSLEEFIELSKKGNLIPVYAIISTDHETPVTAFDKLRDNDKYSFLLESAKRTGDIGRYSFVGRESKTRFKSFGNKIFIENNGSVKTFETKTDPLSELQKLMKKYRHVASDKLPTFSGGALGYIGYDVVRFFETNALETPEKDELDLPDMIFMIVQEMVAFDHLTRRLYLISNAHIEGKRDVESAYMRSVEKIHRMQMELDYPTYLPVISLRSKITPSETKCNTTKERFCEMVTEAKEKIFAGDIFQVVLSQRFSTEYKGDSLHLYRTLWAVNPSPYMFCIDFGKEFSLVGSSPEVHVRSIDRKVEIRPIAGTRKRGKTDDEDKANEKELLDDPKERAEHVMLIDLARNDIGRTCQYGTVNVTDSFGIERFSHVMHIVSNIEGKLCPELNAYDVMRTTFPAGTVSGAPKIRAMQILAELEGNKRGVYAGAVGYFGFDGNLDSCIALRTVVLKKDRAYVQAGAGIVADSTPEGEYEECVNKAMGMMRAIAQAKAMLES